MVPQNLNDLSRCSFLYYSEPLLFASLFHGLQPNEFWILFWLLIIFKPCEEFCRDDDAAFVSKCYAHFLAHYHVQLLLDLSVQLLHRNSAQEKRKTGMLF